MWWEIAASGLIAAEAWWIASPSEKRLRARGEAFARRNRAFVDSEFVMAFNRATTWSFRFIAAAFLLYWAILTALEISDVGYVPAAVPFLTVLGSVSIASAGFRLRVAGREFPVPTGHGAVARPRRVSPTDYVSRWAQTVMWLDVTLAAVLALGVVARPRSGDPGSAFTTLTMVGAIALIASAAGVGLFARALCERPQAAVDPCHLYFQDAWRGEFLLGAFGFVAGASLLYLGSVTTYLDLSGSQDGMVFEVMLVLGATLLFAVLGSRLQFRKRLWPTLAPGQVLLPGEPLPPKVGASA